MLDHTEPDLPPAAETRYAAKIARVRAGAYRRGDFMIADAKDADLSGGVLTTGRRRGADGRVTGNRTRVEFLAEMRGLIEQDVIDILLASSGNIEALAESGAFAGSAVMPAFRANETTCVWGTMRGGRYRASPSRPHRVADLSLARASLCLYSITFLNDAERDAAALEAYAAFRAEARARGIAHFLEVFNPNIDIGVAPDEMGAFVNDCVVRGLASLTRAERPEFLKVAYNGPDALEELVAHDPAMVVGVLGGGGGTHRDTFELVAQAERFGGRLALFGRKINMAEHQPSLIRWMRRVADAEVAPAAAVRGYHADLARLGLAPDRDLDTDLAISEDVLRPAATAS
ncbi:MAG: hypothetical protein DI556_06155 [Rhodovulum sulfidophilum]|uniref:Aldolase n=1 Tax=Rhodovulum sulfidophilum TaxID=35806 RepID=A0A2W5QGU0_RHOSU|nr:MAG: hypothetical protein DI556_06155 [Rhodovulum sulfidophilum]